MNDGPGISIRDQSDEREFFTAGTAGLARSVLDSSNLLGKKYLHGGPEAPKRDR